MDFKSIIFLLTLLVSSVFCRADEGRIYGNDAGSVVAVMGGEKHFYVPRGYFRNRSPGYANSESWWLEVLFPGFSPWRENNREDEKEFHAPGGGRQLHITLYFSPSLDESHLEKLIRSSNENRLYGKEEILNIRNKGPDIYTLEAHYVDFHQVLKILNQDGRNRSLGDLSDDKKAQWEDLYIHREVRGQKALTLIQCDSSQVRDPADLEITGKKYIRVPHCRHNFDIPEYKIYVTVSYRRIYLGNWREIQAGVVNLIQQFSENKK